MSHFLVPEQATGGQFIEVTWELTNWPLCGMRAGSMELSGMCEQILDKCELSI